MDKKKPEAQEKPMPRPKQDCPPPTKDDNKRGPNDPSRS